MTKNMLIDAIHPEETRVVVSDHNQIDEFDFESRSKAPLRGNIYLAKVTRVEPSLQAAFVEYGGNRHGFLAFNEIHPDYYQIPVSDREQLLKEQAAEDKAEGDAEEAEPSAEAADENGEENSDENGEAVADVGGDAHEEAARPINTRALHRKYKIQEVIKRRQVILVQVMKEERGNKGAALTTYLSLAGRYCVLMPNTARGGGISRKISNSSDRKKLKTIVGKLDVPDGMGLIVRTAGAQRTLAEIRRDWNYLSNIWQEIRDKTVESTAPALVYEEGSLIRRCIRDLYSKDYDEVLIAGADAYKEAKGYMKLLMPSHARKVKQYTDTTPLFKQHGVEDKLAALFNPIVALPSGGYLVINPTEALVSIDVNSGKSTREESVERTALATNLEAAVEVARQARLRDLAGLLVIDFIDMDENRNNRSVERKMKEALKNDRARIQVGRISSFGLMEMSRQRMRAGVLEGSSETCSHCNGSGMVRSVESRALHVLRQLDETAGKYDEGELIAHLPQDVAIYLLNQKRTQLSDIEARTGLSVTIAIDTELNAMEMAMTLPDQNESTGVLRMEGDPNAALDETGGGRRKRRRGGRNRKKAANGSDTEDTNQASDNVEAEDETALEADETQAEARADGDAEDEDKPKRRRRRGRRGGRNRRRKDAADGSEEGAEETAADDGAEATTENADETPTKIIIEVAAQEETDEATGTSEDEDPASDDAMPNDMMPEDANVPDAEVIEASADAQAGDADDDGGSKRKGWWRR